METRHGEHESQHRGAIGWRDFNPAVAGGKSSIGNDAESELVHKEAQASLLVGDVDAHEVQAKVRAGAIEAERRRFHVALEVCLLRKLDDGGR